MGFYLQLLLTGYRIGLMDSIIVMVMVNLRWLQFSIILSHMVLYNWLLYFCYP